MAIDFVSFLVLLFGFADAFGFAVAFDFVRS